MDNAERDRLVDRLAVVEQDIDALRDPPHTRDRLFALDRALFERRRAAEALAEAAMREAGLEGNVGHRYPEGDAK